MTMMVEHLIMADLIFMSRGASTAKEGERLTLINVNGWLLLLGVEVKAEIVNSTSKIWKIEGFSWSPQSARVWGRSRQEYQIHRAQNNCSWCQMNVLIIIFDKIGRIWSLWQKTDLCGTNILHAELTGNSTLMIAWMIKIRTIMLVMNLITILNTMMITLMITSSMLCISWTVSMLFAFKCFRKALRDHLCP